MRRLIRPSLRNLLSAVLVLVVLAPLASPPQARAADAGLVIEALRVLEVNHFKPIDPVKTLNAALASLRSRLSSAGVAVDLPDIPAGTSEANARRMFTDRFATAQNAGAAAGLTETQLAYQAIRGMTESFQDSHTGFLTPEQNRERRQRQRGEAAFDGIGIVLMPKDGKYYVRTVLPDTPAGAAGLKEFDRIVKVNDVPTGGLTADQVSEMIRGPVGTVVSLTLQRSGVADPVVATITRAPIRQPAIYRAQVLEGGIGYIQLSQFIEGSGREFRSALGRLRANGMRALILDIRGNIGGYLNELDSVLNALLPPRVPIYIEIQSGGTQVVRTTGSPVLPLQTPVVVLIDEGSASAAELLAAAVKENQRGTLVGEKTAGAVEVSIFVDLSDGSGLSVTVFEITTGRGMRLENVGVKPDVVATLTAYDFDTGQDRQLSWAIRLLQQTLALPARP